MRKLKLVISVGLIGLLPLTACNKNNDNASKKNVKDKMSAMALKVMTWAGTVNGHTVKVTYYTGHHPSTTVSAYNGVTGTWYNITEESSACVGDVDFCKPISLVYNSPVVGTDGNGTKTFTNLENPTSANAFQGFIGLSNDGQNLVFATDRTKVGTNCYNMFFAGETVDVNYPFPLDAETKEATGINFVHPVIPTGHYEMYVDGNIIWWQVPISSIIEPMVKQ